MLGYVSILRSLKIPNYGLHHFQVLGAADPSSGTASVVEVVRGLGALVRAGWKPLRTIVIASWDAEEVCLFGSPQNSSLLTWLILAVWSCGQY